MKTRILCLALIAIMNTTCLSPVQMPSALAEKPALSGKQVTPPTFYLTGQIQGFAAQTTDPTKLQGITSVIHQKRTPEIVSPAPAQIAQKVPVRTDAKFDTQDKSELDFDVKNATGKTIYVTCFSWVQTRDLAPWRWSKSPVYALEPDRTCAIDIITLKDKNIHKDIFGYLGVFNKLESAHQATIELLQDKNKIDLDMLYKIKNQTVVIQTEQYGFKAPILDHELVEQKKTLTREPELDFYVTNNTGKTIFTCCFVYQKKAKSWWFPEKYGKDDMSVWYYSKTKLLKLEPGQTGLIDVATVVTGRDREYIRGFLAVFNEDQEKLAQEATYEISDSTSKLYLGLLQNIKDKKIIIETEKYGIKDDIIDYVVKPTQKPDFKKLVR